MQRRFLPSSPSLVVFLCAVFLTALAWAQTSIAGTVRDESGGVLPGATVETSSPVLIEGAQAVTTDEQGRYRIEALRPGPYKVTFSLVGFGTFVRTGVDVPSDTVVTLNADMKVGALEESVTVSGQSPQIGSAAPPPGS